MAVTNITGPTTITAPGAYRVANDIITTGAPIIEIKASHVQLDLGGHTLSVPLFCAIQTAGTTSDVTISNGTIEDSGTGVCLHLGASRYTMRNLILDGNDYGVQSVLGGATPGCTVSHCTISNSAIFGIAVFGDNQSICYNRVSSNRLGNIRVEKGKNARIFCNTSNGSTGDNGIRLTKVSDSLVASNTCIGNDFAGIRLIDSDNNRITRNRCVRNDIYGINLDSDSTSNLLTQNFAQGHVGPDLSDGSAFPTCPNTWQRNLFVTDSESDGPGVGCIQ